jgi:hypothetical protein
MEDLQDREADRKWHRFGAGLGGFDAFVSVSFAEKTREFNSVLEMYCSYLRRGERMVFYAFWSWHVAFQALLDLKTRGALITLHLEGRYSSEL